jgi:hypothetical protein
MEHVRGANDRAGARELSGREAAQALSEAVGSRRDQTPEQILPSAPVRVVLDGRATDYFEWIGAGRVDADLGRGTMARGERVLRALHYGTADDRLALRLDCFSEPASAALDGLDVVVELRAPVENRLRVSLRSGECGADPVGASLGQILELAVPLPGIDESAGTTIAFRVVLEDRAGREIECLPGEGFVSFPAGAYESDWIA